MSTLKPSTISGVMKMHCLNLSLRFVQLDFVVALKLVHASLTTPVPLEGKGRYVEVVVKDTNRTYLVVTVYKRMKCVTFKRSLYTL